MVVKYLLLAVNLSDPSVGTVSRIFASEQEMQEYINSNINAVKPLVSIYLSESIVHKDWTEQQ